MSKQNVIFIHEGVEDIPVIYFPVSNSLQRFLRKEKVKFIRDLRELSPDTIEQILYNKKKPFSELRELILSIQDNDSGEITFTQEHTFADIVNVSNNPSFNEDAEDAVDETEPMTTLKQSHKIILIFWHESLKFGSCALLNYPNRKL